VYRDEARSFVTFQDDAQCPTVFRGITISIFFAVSNSQPS
jgi:hypothetical protein